MSRLVWCWCLLLAGCGGPSGDVRLALGPDAVVAASGNTNADLVWIVNRPVYDRVNAADATVDPRTLIAIESPSRATWIVSARVDADAGLRLSAAMAESLRMAPAGQAHQLSVTFGDAASGHRVIDDGYWQWDGPSETADGGVYTMSLRDAGGEALARVRMDAATARNLHEHLLRTIRAAPARGAGGINMEQTP